MKGNTDYKNPQSLVLQCKAELTKLETDKVLCYENYKIGKISRDDFKEKKKLLEELPITIFSIHGNHEQRPYTIDGYEEKQWHGGTVYVEEECPSLLFAKDGEIFDLDGKKTIVMGGAYSIDKAIRIAYGWGWWEDEQPSEKIKAYVA